MIKKSQSHKVTRSQVRRKGGFTLIVVILLMSLLAITALSLTTFVVEKLRLSSVRENEINAYYIAQAGIYYGIYQYRISGVKNGTSESYYPYNDRGFNWIVTRPVKNIITITSTGYSPKSGSGQIQKKLEATYNTSTKKLTGLRDAS